MGKMLEQTACPKCDSSKAFTVYQDEDGKVNGWCYKCQTYFKYPYKDHKQAGNDAVEVQSANHKLGNTVKHHPTISPDLKVSSIEEGLLHPIRELKDRKINHATCEHYGVRVGVDTRDGLTPVYHLYPLTKNGELSGYKQRFVKDKRFSSIGDVKETELFGANVVKPTGKKLFITEGELDCLSLYQTLKQHSNVSWEPSVVSLPHGAQSASKNIANNLELIHGYDQIVLCFDSDAAGKSATSEVCKLLAGKVYVAKLPAKDPNECLLKGKAMDLYWAVQTNTKKYQPDNIVSANDCWDRYKKANNAECYPYPSTMSGLNEKTYGVRPGSIVTWTSGTGCGKTQIMRELKYHYLHTTDFKIADIALEEDIGDTISGMLSLHLNKRINLPDVNVSEEEERRAFDDLYGSDRIALYDYSGGMNDDNLFTSLRYLAGSGYKMIFLDHLHVILSEFASEGGENSRAETIMANLFKFVKETGVILFLVVHLRKTDGKPFELGADPSVDDVKGAGGIKQFSFDIIAGSRNQQHKDLYCANTTKITVLKCRLTGRTGTAGYLHFDDSTGRMIQVDRPAGYYEREKKKL